MKIGGSIFASVFLFLLVFNILNQCGCIIGGGNWGAVYTTATYITYTAIVVSRKTWFICLNLLIVY